MDVLTTITEYKQYLKAAGYAPATMDSYRKNLDQFCRYLQGLGAADLRTVSHQTICDYQAAVMAQPIAMESKALKLRPVKRLFEYLVSTHKLLINPAEGISRDLPHKSQNRAGADCRRDQKAHGTTQPVIEDRYP